MTELLLLGLVGVAAGFVNVMAGGGSLLSVPALLMFDLSGPAANGTNRVAIVAQNISAVTTYFRSGISNLKLSLTLIAAALPGSLVGALVGARLDGEWFDRLVALVMLAVMGLMLTGSGGGVKHEGLAVSRGRLLAGHLAMVGAGFWGGFIQLGVGFIIMPILHRILGLDLVATNAQKVVVILGYSLLALTVFSAGGHVDWLLGLALACGNATGGWLGARMSIRRGETFIRVMLFVTLSVLVVKLLVF